MTGIIFLNYKRKDYSINVLHSIKQIGCEYELLEVEMFGIAAAINYVVELVDQIHKHIVI